MLTVYKASAGSGKTFQLALHYLKMVLGQKEPGSGRWRLNPALLGERPSRVHRHILAVTFTNKATEEMKSRIVGSLSELARAAKADDHDYAGPLMDEFVCSFDELRRAAQQALVSVLVDFSFFNVSTIDSFFQTVLRTFARELGIQGDYNIEISTTNAIRGALNLLLDHIESAAGTRGDGDGDVRQIRGWLENRANDATSKYNPFDRNSNDFDNLVKIVEKIYSEDFKPLKAELDAYLDDPDKLRRFDAALEAEMPVVADMLRNAVTRARAAIAASGQEKYLTSNTIKLLDKIFNGENDFDRPSAGLTRMAKGEKTLGKTEYSLKKGGELNDAYVGAIDTLYDDVQRAHAHYRTIRLLRSKVPQLEFIKMAERYVEALCKDDNILILDDTSTFISRIINGSEIPFVYEHLGTHLRHFLIDEFQDTSRLQWQNLLPLVKNSHASDCDSLIIGDIKQAIYRFRNSDASILGHDLENKDFPHPSEKTVKGSHPSENRNYRTAHGIVRFNNTVLPVFSHLALDEPSPAGYTGASIQQQCAPSKSHLDARITLIPYDYNAETPEGEPTPGEAEPGIIASEDAKIDALLAEIRRQLDEGYRKSDIAVLYRYSKNIKKPLKALLEAGYDVQSSDSLYLRNASSVRLVVSLLKMLADTGKPGAGTADSESGDKTKKSRKGFDPNVFESRFNFFLYQNHRDGRPVTPQEAIDMALDLGIETEGVFVTGSVNDSIREIFDRHPATLVSTVEAILASGLIHPATIRTEKDYIAAFSDLVLEYSERHDNDLNGFLAWWEKHQTTASIVSPPDTDAIRVMSVHSAKGLEFDCVHLVDFDWKLIDDRESVWLDIRPADGDHPLNPEGIDTRLPLARELYPPLINFDLKYDASYIYTPLETYLAGAHRAMRADALNLAYVALTRPVKQLAVYYSVTGYLSGELKTVGDVLAATLDTVTAPGFVPENPELCLTVPADLGADPTKPLTLEIEHTGEKTPEQLDKEAKAAEKERKRQESNRRASELYNVDYPSSAGRDITAMVYVSSLERNPENPDAELSAEETAVPADKVGPDGKADMTEIRKYHKMENTRRGLDLHEILSYIPHVAPGDDVGALFDDAFGKAAHSQGFNAADRDDYRATVLRILDGRAPMRWFDPAAKITTEMPYYVTGRSLDADDDDPAFELRRIDRMVELPDGTVEIVDYKFTQAPSKEVAERYEAQVRQYVDSMSRIFKDRTVKGYLWYCDNDTVVPVNPSPM